MNALCGPHFRGVFAKITHRFRIGRNFPIFIGKSKKNASTRTIDFVLDAFYHISTPEAFAAAKLNMSSVKLRPIENECPLWTTF